MMANGRCVGIGKVAPCGRTMSLNMPCFRTLELNYTRPATIKNTEGCR